MLAVTELVLSCTPGLAAGRDLQVAPGAWTLEQFGTDVAVLRSSPVSDRSGEASLLFACSAGDRRVGIVLPADLAAWRAEGPGTGSALIGATGSSRTRGGAVLRFKVAQGGTLVTGTVSATKRSDPIARLALMLAEGVHDLDLLVSWGSAPVALTRLDVYRLSLRGAAPGRGDVAAFVNACRTSSTQRDR